MERGDAEYVLRTRRFRTGAMRIAQLRDGRGGGGAALISPCALSRSSLTSRTAGCVCSVRYTGAPPPSRKGEINAHSLLISAIRIPPVRNRRDLRRYSASPAKNAPEPIVGHLLGTKDTPLTEIRRWKMRGGASLLRSYFLIPRNPYLRSSYILIPRNPYLPSSYI